MEQNEKQQIIKYIEECENLIKLGDNNKARKLEYRIVNIFQEFIPNITDGLDEYSSYYNLNEPDLVNNLEDIELLKERLEFFVNANALYMRKDKLSKEIVNLNTSIKNDNGINNSGNSTNTNTNNNTNTVNATLDIKVALDKVRKEIAENEYLDDDAKAEINEQLDQIESVMGEDQSNNEKWKKLKSVVNWVTTKGYKIGQLIMPVITKALFPDTE